MSAYTAVLMDPAEAPYNSVVFNDDMPGKGAVVGENDMVADRAIMSNVRVS